MRVVSVVLVLITGCYSPSARDCSYRCTNNVCPQGLTCELGFCREPGRDGTCGGGDGGADDAYDSPYARLVKSHNPVGYWRLGEGVVATRVTNEMDAAEPSIVRGTVTFGATGALAGDPSTAAELDQVDGDCIEIGSFPEYIFEAGTPFTVEAWVLLRSVAPAQPRIIAGNMTSGSAPPGYQLVIEVDGFARLRTSDGVATSSVSSLSALPSATWVHVVGIYDGVESGVANARVMINGVIREDTSLSRLPAPTNVPFSIGCRANGEQFDGTLDEVAIYPRALLENEVRQHHIAGTTGIAPQ